MGSPFERLKLVHSTAWSSLLLLVAVFTAFCWPHGPFDTRYRIARQKRIEQQDSAEARFEALRAEIDGLRDHDWAGLYRPDFFCWDGPILWIAPENGVVAIEGRNCGASTIENHGEVTEVTDDRIELALAIDPALERTEWSHSRRPLLESDLVRIRWCDRRYLVAESQMLQFCNGVNWMGDGSCVSFVREVRNVLDADGFQFVHPVTGLPEVPEAWRPYLLEHPIDATLISLGPPTVVTGISQFDRPIRVTGRADRGSASGLLPGMILHWDGEEYDCAFEVVSVSEDECTLESVGNGRTQVPDRQPPIGTRLTTARTIPD